MVVSWQLTEWKLFLTADKWHSVNISLRSGLFPHTNISISALFSLISMAVTAAQNMYVRPKLNEQNVFEIEEGRHPLMEHVVTQFQQNNFYSGGKYSHMKIVTGPNGSGKSMYLKQIALIVFLAHVGSYVPAKSANISLVHSIHSRMQATESAAVRLSAFMIDVSQVRQRSLKTFNLSLCHSWIFRNNVLTK